MIRNSAIRVLQTVGNIKYLLLSYKSGMWKRKLEAIKFLWKRKHFEERSWKRKRTRKHL